MFDRFYVDDLIKRPRAQRFVRAIPLLYRVLGRNVWERGITINTSESGILMEATHPIPLRTRLELKFQLVERFGSGESGEVRCVGEVVRHGLPTPSVPYPIGVQFAVVQPTESLGDDTAA